MAIVVDLQDLIVRIEERTSDDPLSRLALASGFSDELTGTADQLLTHFVTAAREAGASWTEIGGVLGVSKQGAQQRFDISRRLRELLRRGPAATARELPLLERFTPRARRSVTGAADEARRLNHEHVWTEHLLLGLLGEAESISVKALARCDRSAEAVRAAVEAELRPGEEPVAGPRDFTPKARRALERSMGEALRFGHNYIGTEHLLLVLATDDGIAGETLRSLGLTYEQLRVAVAELLADLGIATDPS